MNKEDKDLLLKDLAARLPYGVMVDYENHIYVINEIDLSCKDIDYITVRIQDAERLMCAESVMIENVKPYFRPMSSMTEEEIFEFIQISDSVLRIGERKSTCILSIEQIDWLLAHYFDFRNLISKNLAIEVTKENNPYEA